MAGAAILYIEDNEDYIGFVKRAIRKIDDNLDFGVVMDGKKTLEFFSQNREKNKMPRLILLDINLPDYNGIDLLKKLRDQEATRYVPVVMLSTSENRQDMKRSFDNGANAYVVKPAGIAHLTETLNSVCNFWLNHNKSAQ